MPSIFVTINGVISGCISGFGAIGNILIIVAFLKTKHLQTVNNIFLFQLAIVDFTKAVFLLTVKTYTQLSEEHYINGFYCPFSGFLACVTFIHSALLLAAIAVVRYIKIVKPKAFETFFAQRRMICYCSGLAFATTLLALLPIFGVGRYAYSHPHGVCFTNWDDENMTFRTLFYVYVMGVCYPVLVFCYSFIFFTLRKHKVRILANAKIARRRSAQKAASLAQRKRVDSYKKLGSTTNLGVVKSDEPLQDSDDIKVTHNGEAKVVKWDVALEMGAKEDETEEEEKIKEEKKKENETEEEEEEETKEEETNEDEDEMEGSENTEAKDEPEKAVSTQDLLKENGELGNKRKISVPKKDNKSKSNSSSLSRHAMRNEIRVTKIMFVVVIAFSICWLPAFFTTVIEFAVGHDIISKEGKIVIITLVDMKVLLNPLIYGIWNKQFRQALKALFLKGVAAVSSSTRDGDSKVSHSQSNANN